VGLDVVRCEGVHVVWVPGVDEQEPGDAPVGTPDTNTVLANSLSSLRSSAVFRIRSDFMRIRIKLLNRK
jgi:hypothetical protein